MNLFDLKTKWEQENEKILHTEVKFTLSHFCNQQYVYYEEGKWIYVSHGIEEDWGDTGSDCDWIIDD